jgi:hypothetical protein
MSVDVQALPNPYGSPQTILQTKKIWMVHFLETGFPKKRLADTQTVLPRHFGI